jgi:hypothetical protein
MDKAFIKISFLVFLLVTGFGNLSSGAETKTPGQTAPAGVTTPSPAVKAEVSSETPAIRMITPGFFEIGGIRLNKQEGIVEFDAAVNMDKGLLEYLIVGNGGKTHESLLRAEIEPYNLQIALLMIGLEGTMNPLSAQGDSRLPTGDPITIWVKWEKNGKIENLQVDKWVADKNAGNAPTTMNWVFTGSIISNGVFMAQVEKSIAAIYHDPIALIDNTSKEGASDEIWFVNEKEVPPAGTKVTVTIRKKGKDGR